MVTTQQCERHALYGEWFRYIPQDSQRTYNIPFRRVRVTIVAEEEQ
jgi:hypothetical protein